MRNSDQIKVGIICALIAFIPWVILFSLLGVGDVLKLWKVMTAGFEWIITFIILLVITFALHKKYEKEFTLGEYLTGSIVLLISLMGTMMLTFYSTTDLADDDRINSYITHIKWEEEHYDSHEECESRDDDGNCTSYRTVCDYVPDSYIAYDSVGNIISITKSQFLAIGNFYGTTMQREWHDYPNDHCSDGYWNWFYWGGTRETKIPSSIKHNYVNYIKASHSLLKVYGRMRGYEKNIVPYPEVYEGPLGPFYIDRIIDKDNIVSEDWKQFVNKELCLDNSYLGPKKEVNILVYFTKRDKGFYYALHEAWHGGKKNDVIVLIGMNDDQTISWVEIMSWTPHEGFKIQLRDNIQEMKTIQNAKLFVKTIVNQINMAGKNGFKRLEMSSMEYLIADIELPWWAYIVSTLMMMILYLPLLTWFFKNDIRN